MPTQGLQRAAEMVMRLAPDVACFQERPRVSAAPAARHEKKCPFLEVLFEKKVHQPQKGAGSTSDFFLFLINVFLYTCIILYISIRIYTNIGTT